MADSDGNLRDEILAMDSEMFAAFNERDVQAMRELFGRKLLSTEVCPVPDFGAIQTGEHHC